MVSARTDEPSSAKGSLHFWPSLPSLVAFT
jgi:hypothetical protein